MALGVNLKISIFDPPSVGGTYTLEKNIEKEFSSHETRAMSPRGGLTMGRTAEGRSELAKLADDSASSADAAPSHPPTRSKVNDGETIVPLCIERRGNGTGDHEMQDSRKDKRVHTRNDTDSGDAEERRETKQSAARPRQSAARPPRSTGHAEHDST